VSRKLKSVENSTLYQLRFFIGFAIVIGAIIISLLTGIGSVPTGLSRAELLHLNKILSLGDIFSSLTGLFPHLVQWTVISIFGFNEFGLRIGTVLLALAGLSAFFCALRALYSTTMALMGVFLLGTSSWMMHSARVLDESVMIVLLMSATVLVATKVQLTRQLHWIVIGLIVLVLGFTTPLFPYFIMGILAGNWRDIRQLWRSFKKPIQRFLQACCALGLILLSIGVWQIEGYAQRLFNIPSQIPSPRMYLENIADTLSYVFWQAFDEPARHLAQLPMLDIFTASMVAFGLYTFERSWPAKRTKFVAGVTIFLVLGISLNPTSSALVALQPIVYLLAALGTVALLKQWYSIFPNNPLARLSGIAPLSIGLLLVFNYHYTRYYEAWAQSPETKRAFSAKPTALEHDLSNNTSSRALVVVPESDLDSYQWIESFSSHHGATTLTPSQLTVEAIADIDIVYLSSDIVSDDPVWALFENLTQPGYVFSESRLQPILFTKYILSENIN
jgi:hypothetical protein